ncbi:MAG: hypothetical protein H0X36_07830 [Sphingomonadaceae bacterium]|nr:hypothetical protein [Sphingomonadaceae bacterium]
MVPDWELWACAAHVERQHGQQAALFVAERIGALALAGDIDGVEVWEAIALRLVQMRNTSSQPRQSRIASS